MELFNDSGGPSLDIGVEKRLYRMDKNVRVTFSYFAIDMQTSYPMTVNPNATWEPAERAMLVKHRGEWLLRAPCYHLWSRRSSDDRWWYVKGYPAEQGFGHREVAALEADVVRTGMTPSEIVNRAFENEARKKEEAKLAYRDERKQLLNANKRRIEDLVRWGKSGRRQAKISSYPGQKNRSTPGEFLSDPKEDGWELRNEE